MPFLPSFVPAIHFAATMALTCIWYCAPKLPHFCQHTRRHFARNVLGESAAAPHPPVHASIMLLNYGPTRSVQRCTAHEPSSSHPTVSALSPDTTLHRSNTPHPPPFSNPTKCLALLVPHLLSACMHSECVDRYQLRRQDHLLQHKCLCGRCTFSYVHKRH